LKLGRKPRCKGRRTTFFLFSVLERPNQEQLDGLHV